MAKIPKESAGYIHAPKPTNYTCDDCRIWHAPKTCVWHRPEDKLLARDSCDYWVQGPPESSGTAAVGYLTPQTSGFVRNPSGKGYGCKRCEYFSPSKHDCAKVDKDSPGDDPHQINPAACCNLWQPDPTRAKQ